MMHFWLHLSWSTKDCLSGCDEWMWVWMDFSFLSFVLWLTPCKGEVVTFWWQPSLGMKKNYAYCITLILFVQTYNIFNDNLFFIPWLGCHKVTASLLQGVVTGHKAKNKNLIQTHIYILHPTAAQTYLLSSSHTSVSTRLPSILSHTSSILTISPHIHAWQGHYNPAHSGTLTSCSVS